MIRSIFILVKLFGTFLLGLLLYASFYLLQDAVSYRLDGGMLLGGIVLFLFSTSVLLLMWVPNEKKRFKKLLGFLENSGMFLFFLFTTILMGAGTYLAVKEESYGFAAGAAVLFLGSAVFLVVALCSMFGVRDRSS
ncbi:hypothetical protein FB479_10597 [Brevibacillus sp. AG162]|uniref:hypothetical protein n=1 Tax=Brevibacillus sp. AG162 TaxID=2572910 RepID=UPI001153AC19|nr:hypothetical protein [Brevibacillus sp. AG162]TQK62317.1 hypothetical protein FB479_10597 [Brevibacillus sp. AG162]